MPSTYSPLLRIQLQADGENDSTWGQITNTNFELFEDAIAGLTTVTMSSVDVTLSEVNGANDQQRNAFIEIIGTPASALSVVLDSALTKNYIVKSSVGNSNAVTIKYAGGTGVSVDPGTVNIVFCDGVTIVRAAGLAGNFVTLDTVQTVTARKTFVSAAFTEVSIATAQVSLLAPSSVTGGNYTGFFLVSGSLPNGGTITSLGVVVPSITSTTADPSGTNGQFYYSPAQGKARVYSGGAWGDVKNVIVQRLHAVVTANSGSESIPDDNTAPLISEGAQIWSRQITLQSASNQVRIQMSPVVFNSNSGSGVILALFRDSTCIAAIKSPTSPGTVGAFLQLNFDVYDAPGGIGPYTYSARAGAYAGGNWYVGQSTAGRFAGLAGQQSYTIEESIQ